MARAADGSPLLPPASATAARWPFLAPFATRSFRFQRPADLCTAWALEMETLILGWYVLVQTGSVLWLTAFGALQFIGTLASPLLGTLGDRLGLRRVLASMRFAYAALSGVILLLAATGQLSPWAVLAVAGVAGMLRPSDIGMRTALVSATVPPQHLMAAMGIARTSMDSAKVAGALAGAGVVAAFGMVVAYAAISLIHLAGALLTLRTDSGRHAAPAATGQAPAARPSPWRELREGLAYIWHTPVLLAAMAVAALVNLSAFPFSGGLMPYIARDVFMLDQRGRRRGGPSRAEKHGGFLGSAGAAVPATADPPAQPTAPPAAAGHRPAPVNVGVRALSCAGWPVRRPATDGRARPGRWRRPAAGRCPASGPLSSHNPGAGSAPRPAAGPAAAGRWPACARP